MLIIPPCCSDAAARCLFTALYFYYKKRVYNFHRNVFLLQKKGLKSSQKGLFFYKKKVDNLPPAAPTLLLAIYLQLFF